MHSNHVKIVVLPAPHLKKFVVAACETLNRLVQALVPLFCINIAKQRIDLTVTLVAGRT